MPPLGRNHISWLSSSRSESPSLYSSITVQFYWYDKPLSCRTPKHTLVVLKDTTLRDTPKAPKESPTRVPRVHLPGEITKLLLQIIMNPSHECSKPIPTSPSTKTSQVYSILRFHADPDDHVLIALVALMSRSSSNTFSLRSMQHKDREGNIISEYTLTEIDWICPDKYLSMLTVNQRTRISPTQPVIGSNGPLTPSEVFTRLSKSRVGTCRFGRYIVLSGLMYASPCILVGSVRNWCGCTL